MTELATEEMNDDFSSKQIRSQRRNHQFTDVNCSKFLLCYPKSRGLTHAKNNSHNNQAGKACSNSAVKTYKQGCWKLPWYPC